MARSAFKLARIQMRIEPGAKRDNLQGPYGEIAERILTATVELRPRPARGEPLGKIRVRDSAGWRH